VPVQGADAGTFDSEHGETGWSPSKNLPDELVKSLALSVCCIDISWRGGLLSAEKDIFFHLQGSDTGPNETLNKGLWRVSPFLKKTNERRSGIKSLSQPILFPNGPKKASFWKFASHVPNKSNDPLERLRYVQIKPSLAPVGRWDFNVQLMTACPVNVWSASRCAERPYNTHLTRIAILLVQATFLSPKQEPIRLGRQSTGWHFVPASEDLRAIAAGGRAKPAVLCSKNDAQTHQDDQRNKKIVIV
jgi:hypothetical protein